MRNKIVVLLLVFVLVFVLCSCDPPSGRYYGLNPIEYTAANNSIFGMKTHAMDKIIIFENDEYGRTMYLLRTQSHIVRDKALVALLIIQSSDDGVWYYDKNNFVYYYTDYVEPLYNYNLSLTTCLSLFSDEQISLLKEKNDWGKELSLSKAVKKEICTSDVDARFVSQTKIDKIIVELFGDDDNTFSDPFTQYSDGKSVYLIGRSRLSELGEYIDEFYFVLFLPKNGQQEQEYICEKIDNVYNCQEELDELLERNSIFS